MKVSRNSTFKKIQKKIFIYGNVRTARIGLSELNFPQFRFILVATDTYFPHYIREVKRAGPARG